MKGHLGWFIRVAVSLGVINSLTVLGWAQQRQLTLDDIFDPERRVDFSGRVTRSLGWIDDDHYLQSGQGDQALLVVNALSGTTRAFLDQEAMAAAVADLPGITVVEARRVAHRSDHLMNAAGTALVFDFGDDLYHYEIRNHRVRRLTVSPEVEEEVSFSPDGLLVAFVRNHDLFVVDVAHRREYPLTTDGDTGIRNGLLDWVYQEEIYGRGNFRGYWWSPDSSRIAYLRLDDTSVPGYTIVDHLEYHQKVEVWHYPKAGDPNPGVRLGVVRSVGGVTSWMDLEQYEPSSPLIVNVGWSPDSQQVIFQVQNREQTWLDLAAGEPESGAIERLLRETTETWVNVNGPPTWLDDGSFLWLSEQSGWKHLYHYQGDGVLIRQVTGGEFEVRELHGVDSDSGWVYWSGTERSYIGNDVYRVQLDGSGLQRLSQAEGTHSAQFNPSLTHYIDTWSTITTPPQAQLYASDGSHKRLIDANEVKLLDQYQLSVPEFLQVSNRDGFAMEAMMIKPARFDPTRRYPVYQHVYGGPHVQRVVNRWGGDTYMFWQLVAQQGVIVWIMDNSTASGKGAVSTWPLYKNFGELELRDIEDGVAWLTQQSFVDPARIGLEGWSYGGYMVSYALTHSTSFVMGIAGGDTIYTERYMLRPQQNPDGYRGSSPRFAASDLHGALLMIHGSMDENVHMQNTLQFAHELQLAGKTFEMMIYPRSRHRLDGPYLKKHRHILMLEFIQEHLHSAISQVTATSARR